MKSQLSSNSKRLLRSQSSQVQNGAKVTVGPKTESTENVINITRSEQGVETIEVVCSCGEKIVIRCEYE